MATSVRLDPETEALLKRLARSRGCTQSDVIRDALARLAGEDVDEGPYGLIADLIGVAEGGPEIRARDHKRIVREMLRERPRGGRDAG
jgi:hypothetical protein